jgi:hypothetical protein
VTKSLVAQGDSVASSHRRYWPPVSKRGVDRSIVGGLDIVADAHAVEHDERAYPWQWLLTCRQRRPACQESIFGTVTEPRMFWSNCMPMSLTPDMSL